MIRLVLFLVVPLLELFVLALIEHRIGLLATLALVVLTAVLGARMVGHQGRAVWRSLRQRLAMGEIPDAELAHGGMLLVAGVLLITPGLLTDAVGLLLLVPFVREFLRVRFLRRFLRVTVL